MLHNEHRLTLKIRTLYAALLSVYLEARNLALDAGEWRPILGSTVVDGANSNMEISHGAVQRGSFRLSEPEAQRGEKIHAAQRRARFPCYCWLHQQQ
jgi:hypothetical protein